MNEVAKSKLTGLVHLLDISPNDAYTLCGLAVDSGDDEEQFTVFQNMTVNCVVCKNRLRRYKKLVLIKKNV